MNKNKIDKYIDLLNQEYDELENTLKLISVAFLFESIKKPQQWKQYQRDNIDKFNAKIKDFGKKQLTKINDKLETTFLLAYALTTNQKLLQDDERKELSINVNAKINELINNGKKQNEVMVANLISKVSDNQINIINSVNPDVLRLDNTEELYKQLTKVIDTSGVKDGLKVVYKNQRVVDWKVYMEMNVRTTMSNEITEWQVSSGKNSKVVFYICSQHSDCADDHINYQGKIYYDKDYVSFNIDGKLKNKIADFIQSKKLKSIQEVKDGEPYLTTRPNCRHYFQPVSIDDVLKKDTTTILNDLKMNKGKGDSEQYDNLVQQRYNERQIRKWKSKMQQYEIENKSFNTEYSQKRLAYAKSKVKDWQKQQREFLKGKDYLERDYDRENNDVLVNDLGYRFNKLTTD